MSKYVYVPILMVAWLAACGGGASPADDPSGAAGEASEATAGDAPSADEPACDGLDETKCKITAGCAWSNESTCVLDTALGM